ncbi:hypothetical protein VTN49DRAFT_6242 [Thermomyces lanuginosus]|uniref:uncharacterized protein n=1 Tax=Thermomyces lanuginosus TaxID=5541 RepID=UPI0037442397
MRSLLSYLGWAILPKLVTNILQNIFYGITIRAGDPRPQPGTPRFEKHRRRIFVIVVSSYLLYTLYETFHELRREGNFYQILGVSPWADERTIRSRFRRLAAQYHPDKASLAKEDPTPDGYFVYLKLVQDTLLDPQRRFAYDRFGPDVTSWRGLSTVREYLYKGLLQQLPQYVVGFFAVVMLNMVYWSSWGRFWRFWTIAALLTLELVLLTRPLTVLSPPKILPDWLCSLLGLSREPSFYFVPFQIMSLARQVALSIHIFISQVTPSEVTQQDSASSTLKPATMRRLTQLVQLSQLVNGEASRLLALGLAPFRGDRDSVTTLRRAMKEALVLEGVRRSPEVQAAVMRARKRRQAPDAE